jgi:macrolide-specific efflux system membrane fusion protein
MKEGTTLNATQQSPTVMSIANLATMTVETQISEADVGKLWVGMDVYFTTLSGGNRRWYSTLRQILPKPTTTNNVVTYTGLFDVANDDGALLSGMTTQVYFVTSAARGVLTVPVGALQFAEAPGGAGGYAARPGAAAARGPGAPPVPRGERIETPQPGAGAGPRRFDDVAFAPGQPPSPAAPGGGFNGSGGRGGAAAAARRLPAPRKAKVRVANADGSIAEREVEVGVTSRVTAEVIAGLVEGEQVVAGIVQPAAASNAAGNQGNNNPVIMIPGGGFPGGFPNNRGR